MTQRPEGPIRTRKVKPQSQGAPDEAVANPHPSPLPGPSLPCQPSYPASTPSLRVAGWVVGLKRWFGEVEAGRRNLTKF